MGLKFKGLSGLSDSSNFLFRTFLVAPWDSNPRIFSVDFPEFYRLSHFAFYVVSRWSKFHFQLIFPAVTPSLLSVEAPLDAGHVAFEVIVR